MNGRITAISQYYSTLFFPQLLADKNRDVELILAAFEKSVWPKLHHEPGFARAIVDFVIVGDRATVVELNPFSEATHACLFDWDADKYVLLGNRGEQPAEVRVREKPLVLTKADKMVLADFLK